MRHFAARRGLLRATAGAGAGRVGLPRRQHGERCCPGPALTVADGTAAKASRDGRCQIIVKKKADIDLDGKFSRDGLTVTVEKVGEGGAVVRPAPEHDDRRAHHGTGTEGFSLFSGNG